jgi:hypothetical protein
LNYIGIYNIDAIQQDNKYYYTINRFDEQYPTELRVDNEVVEERIDKFIDCLSAKQITPLVIDICRSRFSGYTPNDQWYFIEDRLLEGLTKLYDLK